MSNVKTRLPKQLIHNAGIHYCCYRLSLLGWNLTVEADKAHGVDLTARRRDSSRAVGIKVCAFSKRHAVSLGSSRDKIRGDVWVILNNLLMASPTAFILLPSEVRDGAVRNEKLGQASYWLDPPKYDEDRFREAWERIGHGGV